MCKLRCWRVSTEMGKPHLHWRYLKDEAAHRWKRTVLTIAGIAMAVALVVLLDVLGRAFTDVSVLPFRSLSADLIVQRSATKAAMPKQMGVMLPYSAQPITAAELDRLSLEAGVEKAGGFVLLWNFGAGRFFSISGLDFKASPPLLGPARIAKWLFKGRLPEAGKNELLVERHYGAFYRYKPGKTIELAGQIFTIAGVVDIQGGGRITASNFYMDINLARRLADLPDDMVNQIFLKVAHIDETEAIKKRIAAWLPQASIMSPGTMLKLFGGISQVIGRFSFIALLGGGLAAAALIIMLLFGNIAERRKEAAILRTLGWTRFQMRRQLAAEMALQGFAGGIAALGLVAICLILLDSITLQLPISLPGENPADFASGGFRAQAEKVALPISSTLWDWLLPPVIAGAFCGLIGWGLSARATIDSLWAAIKAA